MPRSKQSTKKEKSKNRRNSLKYPALDKSVTLKSRAEEIEDMSSYMHKLNEEEKAWLNKFAAEYVHADFSHDDHLHKKRKQKKSIYDRNNARNRDIHTREAAKGMLTQVDDFTRIEDQIDVFCRPLEKDKPKKK